MQGALSALTKLLQFSYHFKMAGNSLGMVLKVYNKLEIPFTVGEEIEQELFQRFRLLFLLFFPGLNAWRHGECSFPATRVCHF